MIDSSKHMKLLGRYDVTEELQRDALEVSYIANDSRMSRQVRIKQLGPITTSQCDELLREGRAVSNLYHSGIIPLYDIGSTAGSVYFVYSMLPGETLDQVLKRSGAMPASNAVHIATDMLEALAAAHALSIFHLDIRPANVFVAANGQHYLMDFGVSRLIFNIKQAKKKLDGQEVYSAPELAAKSASDLRSDLYSVGVILYEMLLGTTPPNILNIDTDAIAQDKIDAKLLNIIKKATSKIPADRFSSAMEMKQALLDYIESSKAVSKSTAEADVSSTLKFLLRRIKSKSDFPAISGVINEINKIVDSDTEDKNKLTQIILQDFSLTNKLLKLVNTASYSQFGGKINTVSKAVSILGFETVRNIATTLIVMDFMQNKSQSAELKDVVSSAFLSGILAVKLSPWKSIQEVEEAMICSMFFNLGKMLSKFYFFDESEEIQQLVEKQGISEDKAAVEILGITYNELGLGIAKSWNLPASMIDGMQRIYGDQVLQESDNYQRITVAVNMANDLCAVSNVSDADRQLSDFNKIKARYAKVTDASDEKIASALSTSLQEISQRSKLFGIDSSKSSTMANMKQMISQTVNSGNASAKNAKSSATSSTTQTDTNDPSEGKIDSLAFLSDGIQDISNTMSGTFLLNDVLQMVLETIYRGIGFKHVMILSRDVKKNAMVARFGFGENIIDILPDFHFSLNFEADVFHITLQKGLDIIIEDVGSPNIANKIPAWHSKALNSRYFLLLPMMLNNVAIGMIYADMLEAKKLKISAKEMELLRSLRNLAVQAITKKTQ